MPSTAGTGMAGVSRSRVRRPCGSAAPQACGCARPAHSPGRWRPTGRRVWCPDRNGPTDAARADRQRARLPAGGGCPHPHDDRPAIFRLCRGWGLVARPRQQARILLRAGQVAGPTTEGGMTMMAAERPAAADQHVLDLAGLRHADLPLVGGKAAGLGELTQVDGAAVPSGFCVTTAVFQQATEGVSWFAELSAQLAGLAADDVEG